VTIRRRMRVRYTQPIEITIEVDVDVEEDDVTGSFGVDPDSLAEVAEDKAQDLSLDAARHYLGTVNGWRTGDARVVSVDHSNLDGIGADSIEDITEETK